MTNHTRSVLYIGVTNDIIRRIIEHRYGFGSEFTAKYRLKYLMHYEMTEDIWSAIAREKEIKKWRREKKEELIERHNPERTDLSDKILKEGGITKEDIEGIVESLRSRYNK